jgi:Protein of unknown function (DUF1566)
VTGLEWQVKVPDLYPGCIDESSNNVQASPSCTFSEAKAYCAALAIGGNRDWRVPSKIESESLTNVENFDGSSLQPLNPRDALEIEGYNTRSLWTSTPYAGPEGGAWSFEPGTGTSRYYVSGAANGVRCVRSP